MRLLIKAAAAAALLLSAEQAMAIDWVTTLHVTAVEATGSPNLITFWVDGPAGSCVEAQGLGPQLYWHARGSTVTDAVANGQSILATLLTARASGRPIKMFGRNSDCEVEYLYLA